MVVDEADAETVRSRLLRTGRALAPQRRQRAHPTLQRDGDALVAEAELEAGELAELVDDGVRDPAPPARAPEPRELAVGVAPAGATERGREALAST